MKMALFQKKNLKKHLSQKEKKEKKEYLKVYT